MRCEGSCGRTFRNGDRVYAIPTRVIVVRNRREQTCDVEMLLCTACMYRGRALTDDVALYTAGIARVT
jgi:hypothetical protein